MPIPATDIEENILICSNPKCPRVMGRKTLAAAKGETDAN
jgi:hypothetical protein